MKNLIILALLALATQAKAADQSFKLDGAYIIVAQAGTPTPPDVAAAPANSPAPSEATPAPTVNKPVEAAPAATAAPEAHKEGEGEPQAKDLIAGAQQAATDWQKLGLLAGLIALVNLLINALKLGPIKAWFEANKKKWLIPYIALGLGAALGIMSAIYTGNDPIQSLIAGLTAGSSAIGVHEATTKLKKAKRTA